MILYVKKYKKRAEVGLQKHEYLFTGWTKLHETFGGNCQPCELSASFYFEGLSLNSSEKTNFKVGPCFSGF